MGVDPAKASFFRKKGITGTPVHPLNAISEPVISKKITSLFYKSGFLSDRILR